MRISIWLLMAALNLVAIGTAVPAAAAPQIHVKDFEVEVAGELAHGLLAKPHGKPLGFVVVTHGYTHNAASHQNHLRSVAELGYLAVAMDYRGPQSGFPIAAGAADTLAATDYLLHRHKVDTVILFSVSMGAAVGGIALAERPGLYDYWIASQPMANIIETWAEATAVCPALAAGCAAAQGIEAETGGDPSEAPDEFASRTAVARVPEFQGLRGVVVLHGVYDGFVPYDQGRELAQALRAHAVPTDFYNVLRGETGGEGTCVSCHAGQPLLGLAGHGTESNDAHTLTRVSWDVTYAFLRGDSSLPADREIVVDSGL